MSDGGGGSDNYVKEKTENNFMVTVGYFFIFLFFGGLIYKCASDCWHSSEGAVKGLFVTHHRFTILFLYVGKTDFLSPT